MADENAKVIENMRARAAQCRRLAKAINDQYAATVLLKMAEEVEADIAQLERDVPNPMPPAPAS